MEQNTGEAEDEKKVHVGVEKEGLDIQEMEVEADVNSLEDTWKKHK